MSTVLRVDGIGIARNGGLRTYRAGNELLVQLLNHIVFGLKSRNGKNLIHEPYRPSLMYRSIVPEVGEYSSPPDSSGEG